MNIYFIYVLLINCHIKFMFAQKSLVFTVAKEAFQRKVLKESDWANGPGLIF